MRCVILLSINPQLCPTPLHRLIHVAERRHAGGGRARRPRVEAALHVEPGALLPRAPRLGGVRRPEVVAAAELRDVRRTQRGRRLDVFRDVERVGQR